MIDDDSKIEIVIDESHEGQRLDKALGHVVDGVSRGQIQKLISNGSVLINGYIATSSKQNVRINDHIVLPKITCDEEPLAQNIPLDIVYDDDHIAVINKQSGLVVHPGAGQKQSTLVNALLHIYGDCLRNVGDPFRPGIVHRLDKDTSGLMMVAKSPLAYERLVKKLSERSINRVYHAFVWAVPQIISDTIDKPIGRHRRQRHKMAVHDEGKQALTTYRLLDHYADAISLVECKLHTGRTHQIRVHMMSIGHYVLGDRLYGIQPTKAQSIVKKACFGPQCSDVLLNTPRQALHAKELSFSHPVTDEFLSFSSPYPADFNAISSALANPNN